MAQLHTLSSLEQETGKDRRTLGKLLRGVPPDGKSAGRDAWFISTVMRALDEAPNFAAEKARLDKARANLAELDLAIREAKVIPAEHVEQAWGAIATEIRTRLMAVPSAAAPRVTPKMTTVEIEAIIRDHIDEALSALSNAAIIASDARSTSPRGTLDSDPQHPRTAEAQPAPPPK